jgi:hypothetical protein
MRKAVSLFGCFCLVFAGLFALDASALNGQTSSLLDSRVLKQKVVTSYTSQIGVRELTGQNDGKEVDMYLASTGFTNNKLYREKTGKGYAWCAAFVTWSFKESTKDIHYVIKIPASAWAPSWFPPSNTIYVKGKPTKVKPERADVFGIYYAKDDRIGHVGFIDDWPEGEYVVTVEGNTNAAGSREGDGVYRKKRLKANIYKVSRWV